MTNATTSHCGATFDYDYGNKRGVCGSAGLSGILQCSDCSLKDSGAATQHGAVEQQTKPEQSAIPE